MARLTVRVIPNASRSEVVGREGSVWKIRLAAPPIDGKANETLIRFLSNTLEVAPSEIEIVRGHASRIKVLNISIAEEDAVLALINAEKGR